MKKFILILSVMLMILALAACGGNDAAEDTTVHTHDWKAATCSEAKTCTICGETEGAAIGHNWKAADCQNPKTCTVCNATEGAPAGHTWADATDTAPKTCTTCGATLGDNDGVTRILLIGHSLGIDSVYLLPDILRANKDKQVVIGILYHSGCRLGQHVDYLQNNAAQYSYYEIEVAKSLTWNRANSAGKLSSVTPNAGNDKYIEDGTIAQTMLFGIQRQDWDIVVLQAGVFDAAGVTEGGYTHDYAKNIKIIKDYVLANDKDQKTVPTFGWNMTWGCPTADMLNTTYTDKFNAAGFKSTDEMYQAIANKVKAEIGPDDFEFMMPTGTAIHNALSSYLECKDVYRDTIHVNDYGRVIAGYVWYCTLFNKNIEELTIRYIPASSRYDEKLRNSGVNFELTDAEKNILIESVKNAMANPYQITPSQYTSK